MDGRVGGDEFGGYFNFAKAAHRIAGGTKNDGQSGAPDGWTVYLATHDAKATVSAAIDHGGHVVVPAMDVMDLGSMAATRRRRSGRRRRVAARDPQGLRGHR